MKLILCVFVIFVYINVTIGIGAGGGAGRGGAGASLGSRGLSTGLGRIGAGLGSPHGFGSFKWNRNGFNPGFGPTFNRGYYNRDYYNRGFYNRGYYRTYPFVNRDYIGCDCINMYSYGCDPYSWRLCRQNIFKREALVAAQEPKVNCVFSNSTKEIRCSFEDSKVECDAISLFERDISSTYTFFGISSESLGGLKTKQEEIKFSLFPHRPDHTFVDTSFEDPILKKSLTYSFYHLPTYTDNGFRITNDTCWSRLLTLFSNSVSTSSVPITVHHEDGQTMDVKIIGTIAFVN